MKLYKEYRWFILLLILPYLLGCAITAAGGTAAGAATLDRRTTGTIIEDQAIEFKTYRIIAADKELDKQTHINITSYNTAVLVTGESPLDEMREKIISIVSGVEKVTHVYDEITIAAPSSMVSRSSDTYITTKVKAKLFADKILSGLIIKVVTEKGIVYLMGLITREESEIATNIARGTGGVQKVVKLFKYIN
ncbi:MAG: BON domain-containing protein [Pseudomonadota bacterium]|nr:BON domain-containing protein [Pseudomonadota bacterium]|tara:strand:- start:10392 stop:10970 length:579 start_codon:yes stop_codon:yes gene_type:complete